MLDKTNANEFRDELTERGQELVLQAAMGIDEKDISGKRTIRIHADGTRSIRHVATNAGQAQKKTSRTAGQRKRSAKLTLRSKKKKFGKAISTKAGKKMKRAMKKRKAMMGNK
jgi:hypothetical protein